MKVRELFDRCATTYEAHRPELIPDFDGFYGTLIEQIPFDRSAELKVLDLGAGTGLLTAMLKDSFPAATFLLTDISEKMLKFAQERFANCARIETQLRDNRDIPESEYFDLIVSALSIHHLAHGEKRRLYADCFRALKPGGKLINADQILGKTSEEEEYFEQTWRAEVRETELDESYLLEAIERMREDQNAPLADQLLWIRQARFQKVGCWYQRRRFAVFGGEK